MPLFRSLPFRELKRLREYSWLFARVINRHKHRKRSTARSTAITFEMTRTRHKRLHQDCDDTSRYQAASAFPKSHPFLVVSIGFLAASLSAHASDTKIGANRLWLSPFMVEENLSPLWLRSCRLRESLGEDPFSELSNGFWITA